MSTSPSSNKGFFNIFILLLLLALLVAGVMFYILLRKDSAEVETPAVVEDTVEAPETEEPLDDGNETFLDANLGFSLTYPDKYRVEEDSAWENAVLILYSGGQSYDLVVQVWDTEAEYEDSSNITVHVVDGKYVTLLNVNDDPEVTKIIESFEI